MICERCDRNRTESLRMPGHCGRCARQVRQDICRVCERLTNRSSLAGWRDDGPICLLCAKENPAPKWRGGNKPKPRPQREQIGAWCQVCGETDREPKTEIDVPGYGPVTVHVACETKAKEML